MSMTTSHYDWTARRRSTTSKLSSPKTAIDLALLTKNAKFTSPKASKQTHELAHQIQHKSTQREGAAKEMNKNLLKGSQSTKVHPRATNDEIQTKKVLSVKSTSKGRENPKKAGIVQGAGAKEIEIKTSASTPKYKAGGSMFSKTQTPSSKDGHVPRSKARMELSDSSRKSAQQPSPEVSTKDMKHLKNLRLAEYSHDSEFDLHGRRGSGFPMASYPGGGSPDEELTDVFSNKGILARKNSKYHEGADHAHNIIELVQQKNEQIERLKNERQELKHKIAALSREIQGIGKMKKIIQEKDQTIHRLQDSLHEAMAESTELRDEVNRISHSQSPERPKSRISATQYQSQSNPEQIPDLIEQLKALIHEENERRKTPDYKTQLLELLQSQNKKTKRSKNADYPYMLSSLEYRTERNSKPVNKVSPSRLFKRNYSSDIESQAKQKLSTSPYKRNLYENIRKLSFPEKLQPSAINRRTRAGKPTQQERPIEFVDTPRKKDAKARSKIKKAGMPGNYRYQIVNPDFDTTRRKYSHDSRPELDSRFTIKSRNKEMLDPGDSIQQVSTIESGLSALKGRILRILEQHRSYHEQLLQFNKNLIQKLDALAASSHE